MSYDRIVTSLPRQSIVVGTTNDAVYLKDLTGNRRFWPIKAGAFDIVALKRDRDQLWAEAAAMEAAGESIRLDPKLWKAAAIEQQQRTVEEPWIDDLNAVLKNYNGKILAADAWLILKLPPGQKTQEHNARFGNAMRATGWTRKKMHFKDHGTDNGYWRGHDDAGLKRIYIERKENGNIELGFEGDDPQQPPV